MLIFNGTVHTMEGQTIAGGWVELEGGLIKALGDMSQMPKAGDSYDAGGGHIMPGLIDAHSHLGIREVCLDTEGDDTNEMTDPCTPHVRAIDAVNPMDAAFEDALAAGITTVLTGPGSANPVGGQALLMRTSGRRIDDMAVKSPAAVKFALGENPKNVYTEKSLAPNTRMATAALIRESLFKARQYMNKLGICMDDGEDEPPEYDMKCEALIPVLKGELPAHFHAHRADDIFTAIRIAKEFELDYVIVHGTEGHLVADILKKEGARVIAGPTMIERFKPEMSRQSYKAPAALAEAGVLFAICTDHPETPEKYLSLCAALAVKDGLSVEEALKAVTINPAKILGIDSFTGSIKAGKSADIAVFSDHPLSVEARVKAVFIEGRRVL